MNNINNRQLFRVIPALVMTLYGVKIEDLIADKNRLDWLSDNYNDKRIGNKLTALPQGCVARNPNDLRAAIDDAMELL